ncbi:MAG TPA: Rho termination factor N-terminal domain-containing protein, partial [Pedococcus sp.]|nr:Rho termination factor N-terminal domain-containing protein [Pedococcus sp.]
MTDTTTLDAAGSQDAVEKPRRSGALTTMKVAELQGLAASMGISGTAKMRKGDLVTAIKARQSGASVSGAPATSAERQAERPAERQERQVERPAERRESRDGGQREQQQSRDGGQREQQNRDGGQREQQNRDGGQREQQSRDGGQRDQQQNRGGQNRGDQNRGDQNRDADQNRGDQNRDQNRGDQNRDLNNDDDGDGRGGRRRNRNRSRSRDKRPGRPGGRSDFGGDYENEPQVADDDVLIPVAGILDVLENYAFVRTSGYLPGANDVYVPLGLVKKNGMRKGDAVTGAVRAQRDDQQQQVQRQKFNALVRLDTINGMAPDEARKRVEFGKLTPLYPQQRLRLETEP